MSQIAAVVQTQIQEVLVEFVGITNLLVATLTVAMDQTLDQECLETATVDPRVVSVEIKVTQRCATT